MASPWNFTIKAGTTWRRTTRWTTPQVDEDGEIIRDASGKPVYEPVDNTGWKAKMQIRTAVNGTLLLTLGTPDVAGRDGDITMVGASGHVIFDIPFGVTEGLKKFGKAVHDIEFTSPDGLQRIPWAEGEVTIKVGVTQ